jgi:hypothetical protein
MAHRARTGIDDGRFVAILNEVWDACGLDWDRPPAASDAAGVAAWADFLRASAERGIAIGDPRWQRLEIRPRDGRPRFHLPDDSTTKAAPAEPDFGVGLALLMSLLGRTRPGDGEKD